MHTNPGLVPFTQATPQISQVKVCCRTRCPVRWPLGRAARFVKPVGMYAF